MYAFCRYIKVANTETLIDALCKIWIGKLRLHAKVARFSRNDACGSFGDKANHADNGGNLPSININDPNTNDFPLALIGCYKDFRAIANTISMCRCEVFLDVEFKYLGGLWVLFEFSSHEVKDNFQKHKGASRIRTRIPTRARLGVRQFGIKSQSYSEPDDSTRDSSSDSSLEASSDFHSDALSDSSSLDLPSTTARASRKRHRPLMTFVPALPPNVEVDPKETSLRDDVIVKGSDEPHLEQDIDPEIQTEIDECFAYSDALRDRGIDARVIVEVVDQEESETGARGSVEVRVERVTHPAMPEDIPEPASEGAVEVTYETLGDLVKRFHDHTEHIPVNRIQLERDNMRLRGTASVESQRVDRLQREILHHLEISSSVTLLYCRKMPNTRSGASMTHEEVEELVTRRVAEEMEAREAVMNLEPLNENMGEQEGGNRGNGNGGNRGNGNGGNGGNGNGGNGGNGNRGNGGNGNGGNGENGNRNRNRNHGMNYGGFMPVARECTFQDFLKCKPHNFSRTEGVVGLTCWFEKMETVFNISNYPSKYQVKYATRTLQDTALTWWNSLKRTIDVDVAYAMKWAGLMKLMTEVYCPRNEIQKIETELMVPDEEDRVERFIGGLPDNIQGNVIAMNPTRL
ncbi:hypothetical protein Tco_0045757 [Tanacetum coccineum]